MHPLEAMVKLIYVSGYKKKEKLTLAENKATVGLQEIL